MDQLTGLDVHPRFQAQLIGGLASGGHIKIPSLEPTICIYQNGGMPFALPAGQAPPDDVALLGTYDIVGPIGPDMPTYVLRDC